MALKVEQPVTWSFPTLRVVFGLLLLAAGIATLSLGWGSALSWLEIGVGMVLLGMAFAHQQGGLPRWRAASLEATAEGIWVEEARARQPQTRRRTLIPARLIRGVQIADVANLGDRVEVVTAFGRLPWTETSHNGRHFAVANELRAVWSDAIYDPRTRPWVEHDVDAFEVHDDEIVWRQPSNFQPLGHMIAVAGPAVAAVPLFGAALGIPFALIASASLLLFLNNFKSIYRFFGYRARVWVEDGELRYHRPLRNRAIAIEEVDHIAANTLGIAIPWTIEINGGGLSDFLKGGESSRFGLLGSLFSSAFHMLKTGWLITLQEHGAPETIELIAAMHDLIDLPYAGAEDAAGEAEPDTGQSTGPSTGPSTDWP